MKINIDSIFKTIFKRKNLKYNCDIKYYSCKLCAQMVFFLDMCISYNFIVF